MSVRTWLLVAALGLTLASSGQAQESQEPAFESQPVAEGGQQEAGADSQDAPAEDVAGTSAIVSAVEGIEAAIRDLIPQEYQAERQKQSDREDRDLAAQEAMALWAFWMFWATAATAAITFVGLVLLGFTLHYTRKASEHTEAMLAEARKATAATIGAMEAAQRSNDIAANTAALDRRPWLYVEPQEIERYSFGRAVSDGAEYNLAFGMNVPLLIKNSGKTPARNVSIFVEAFSKDEASSVFRREAEDPGSNVTSGIGVVPPAAELPQDFWTLQEVSRPPEGGDFRFTSYLVCILRYTDEWDTFETQRFRTIQAFVIGSETESGPTLSVRSERLADGQGKFSIRAMIGNMT